MEQLAKLLTDKISSYNIFINLYPGILFVILIKSIFEINILKNSNVENLIVAYFIGVVMNRIGSIVIEPLMKKLRLVKFATYRDYKIASTKSSFVTTLAEVKDTYRSLLAVFISLFFCKIVVVLNGIFLRYRLSFFTKHKDWWFIIFMIILFAFSYVKQTTHVKKQVEFVLEEVEGDGDY